MNVAICVGNTETLDVSPSGFTEPSHPCGQHAAAPVNLTLIISARTSWSRQAQLVSPHRALLRGVKRNNGVGFMSPHWSWTFSRHDKNEYINATIFVTSWGETVAKKERTSSFSSVLVSESLVYGRFNMLFLYILAIFCQVM